jgi:antitoxin component of RelBE/YafQ-DinJ toxin-antitoxin module
MTEKVSVTVTIDRDLYEEMKEIRQKTDIPISKQIEMRLKGYKLEKL